MKKFVLFPVLFLYVSAGLPAETGRPVTYGLHILAGGRYDDVRMCVGSDAGVKGGPIMDVYADIRFPVGDRDNLALNIPIMRPILFGAAFQMLQFEPQMSYEHHLGKLEEPHFILGGGLGVVFHYGPDYKSSMDDRGEDFFAWGPLFSGFLGRQFPGENRSWMPGIKLFYSPLLSDEYRDGMVLGTALELHMLYKP